MRFSLFFFAAGQAPGADPYDLLMRCASWADEQAIEAIWTPERHLHAFGGVYPAPAVLGAALAARTRRIGIRAGSVVAPLHHPLRIAEAWSVVDNLSGGRVGVSFASGWHREDFLLAERPFAERQDATRAAVEQVRALWRGDSVTFPLERAGPDAAGVDAVLVPRPVQPELPTWLTTGGSTGTAQAAGRTGANLLTHLLGQGFGELEELVGHYRQSWTPVPGGPAEGTVTLMLHTYVRASAAEAREQAQPHLGRYLRHAADLQLRSLARQIEGLSPDDLTEDDWEVLAAHAATRYLDGGSLVGDPETCLEVVEAARRAGVDEIACLVDFVDDPELVLAGLPGLARLAGSVVGTTA